MGYKSKVVLTLVLAKLLHYVWNIVLILNPSYFLIPQRPGLCQQVPGISEGAEDLELLPNGYVVISSGYIDVVNPKNFGKRQAAFYLFDMNQPFSSKPQLLKIDGTFSYSNLKSHGISVRPLAAKHDYELLAVNHFGNQDTVEHFRFSVKKKRLIHIRTIRWDGFGIINDIAWADNGFYFSNYLWSRRSNPFIKLEAATLQLGSVGYCDLDTGCRMLHQGYTLPNGVVVSRDGRFVYMSHGTYRRILVFRKLNNNDLKLVQEFPTGLNLDNLLLSLDGRSMTSAGFGNVVHVAMYLEDPTLISSSQVVRFSVNPETGLLSGGEQLYADEGHQISAASSAVEWRDHIFIGSIAHKAVVCSLCNQLAQNDAK